MGDRQWVSPCNCDQAQLHGWWAIGANISVFCHQLGRPQAIWRNANVRSCSFPLCGFWCGEHRGSNPKYDSSFMIIKPTTINKIDVKIRDTYNWAVCHRGNELCSKTALRIQANTRIYITSLSVKLREIFTYEPGLYFILYIHRYSRYMYTCV